MIIQTQQFMFHNIDYITNIETHNHDDGTVINV